MTAMQLSSPKLARLYNKDNMTAFVISLFQEEVLGV
jgi:hypothetical protein